MAALPYIQLYVADYLADTMHLTAEEHGAYLLLIMNYWQTGKPISEKRIQAITRVSNERITDVTETLQEFFNIDDDNVWHHGRIEAELEKVRSKSIKASVAGKKSAQKRWGNNKTVTSVITNVTKTLQPNDNHTDTDTDTDTDTENINKKTHAIAFDDFYKKYPVKKSKAVAAKKWKSLSDEKRRLAIDGIEKYKASVPEGISFVHPSTYLSQERWTDEITVEKSTNHAATNQSLSRRTIK